MRFTLKSSTMIIETLLIPVSQLEENKGQIQGLPSNPRTIKDGKFRKLQQSIKDDPDMLNLRELIVYPFNKKFVVIGGNMRIKACIELGYKEIPCKVLNPKVTPAQLRAIVMKDNISYGDTDWDMLANEWDEADLIHWGMDIPDDWGKTTEDDSEKENHKSSHSVVKLEITFDDLDEYDHARRRIETLLKDYKGANIRN